MSNQNSIVWIRHIEKLYKNGKATEEGHYQHDPGIIMNKSTLYNADSLISELINKYGAPSKIIVSPLLRTRQTTEILTELLNEKYKIYPNVEYSTDVAEYLGFCKKQCERQKADLHPDTKELFNFNVYLGESFRHFKKRLENHLYELENEHLNIWVITHGIVLSSIYTYLTKTTPLHRPDPLNYVALYKNATIKNF